MAQSSRPLSPHIFIYRMTQMTALLSITHRLTGVLLSVGIVGLVSWIYALAFDADLFATLQAWSGHIMGQLVIVAVAGAWYFHLANGVRHLVWDIGRAFELKNIYIGGWLVIVFSAGATAATAAFMWCQWLKELM